jgi:hypothetical protein
MAKMARLKNVERKIKDTEKFAVIIRHSDGRDMRSDRKGTPMYNFERGAKGSMTVAQWKAQRFYPSYPGFEVDVLDGNDFAVAGNMLLDSVRATYFEE